VIGLIVGTANTPIIVLMAERRDVVMLAKINKRINGANT
jgi:hypothetical protein